MTSLNETNLTDHLLVSSRALPLINRTAVELYTFQDLLKPGPQDVWQSTLPFYHLVIYTCSLVIWIVVLIYFWKMVYFLVDDPYATVYGTAPPYEKRRGFAFSWNSNKILEQINHFLEKVPVNK